MDLLAIVTASDSEVPGSNPGNGVHSTYHPLRVGEWVAVGTGTQLCILNMWSKVGVLSNCGEACGWQVKICVIPSARVAGGLEISLWFLNMSRVNVCRLMWT